MKIPKIIYQSWKTKELNPKMAEIVKSINLLNPDYEYKLYDDNDCREMLKQNFGVNYLNAFDVLIPGAFKCDLWRYAMLYLTGGVYLDIDMEPLVPFNQIISEDDQFVSVVDLKHGILDKVPGIYQAFIACTPKHPIIRQALELTFANIATRKPSINSLDITGPTVMGTAFNLYLHKYNTYDDIQPGKYNNGVVLYSMDPLHTYDLHGRIIINNKYEGYVDGEQTYRIPRLSFYHDEPRKNLLIFQKYITPGVICILLIIIIIIFIFIYRKKL
jgi:hypothetical protein